LSFEEIRSVAASVADCSKQLMRRCDVRKRVLAKF